MLPVRMAIDPGLQDHQNATVPVHCKVVLQKLHLIRSRTFSKLKLHISRTRIEAAARKKRPGVVDVGLIGFKSYRFSHAKCLFTFEIIVEQSQCQASLSFFICQITFKGFADSGFCI